jgi:hypothetical protein
LDLKEAQLLELASHCESLQGYSDIQQMAFSLSQHIQPVQEAIRQAAKELKIRHEMLQVFGSMYQLFIKLLNVFFESLYLMIDFFAVYLSNSLHLARN